MKISLTSLIIILVIQKGILSYGQETHIFIPAEIQKAYEKGTRSYDGKPGKNYWQNTTDYKIRVNIRTSEKLIEGIEEVVYYNNSPDEITKLVIRLYGDVYKKGNIRLLAINENDLHNGVELKDVVINETTYDLEDHKMVQRSGTNISFILQDTLMPGSELTFKASWKQKIPTHTTRRMGAYDSTTLFIGYWYPQIAVYDDIFGWDMLNYTFQTEFYNNLSNYDVKITVPEEYIVWATGMFSNPEEVLPDDIYAKFQEVWSSTDVVKVVSEKNIEKGIHTKNNTWNFIASEVTDFAFALSDHHLWEAAMQHIDNRRVLVNAAYPNDTARDFSTIMGIQIKAMKHFSQDFPGIPYPYDAFTTFISNESGGMEYPMMANNGFIDNQSMNRETIIHEIFHTYFPMYVRTNERRWSGMDEGWAEHTTTIVANRYFTEQYDIKKSFPNSPAMGSIANLPLITSSEFLSGYSYYSSTYSASHMVNAIIHQHLGDNLFLKCYQEYIQRWAKKSPTPYDFFYTFEDVAGQDLSWIWKPWYFEFGAVDIAIDSLKKDRLTIIKKGNKPVPLFIKVNYKNGKSLYINRSAEVWTDGKNTYDCHIPESEIVETILVNAGFVDVDHFDNVYPSVKSLFKNTSVSNKILGNYVQDEFGANFKITRENGLLYLKSPGSNFSRVIYPQDDNCFLALEDSAILKLNMDESGQCLGMKIYVGNIELNFRKLE